ncbi:hypothetical protein SEA_BLINO_40 [Gordonia phage Blino]|uniref:Lipoprotein n=1 Tax=Gordonia phage Blino TaxID=2793696 RepID=A0A7T0Q3L7_9CAUD|nr:hypothetical protein BIZ75_gp39 [Gordonia phage CarolAnn]YP_010114129.1 hypothetical protein KNV70_gp40 [Gordonia phage Blino]AOE44056.1 hypothetical protein SEA_CAROLANN_39 [Gordonia phage CarolAnn]QPL13988.1 hypothetical protein SEA_BLINO_40 [Gordonia phage Blino]
MTRYLPVLCTAAALALFTTSCAGDDSNADPTSSSASAAASSSVPTNSRGAIEVAIGEPVTVTDASGAQVLTVTGTRLDTAGCNGALTPEVVQAKLVATIETGAMETPQWLWPSDIYYVNDQNKVAQNLEVSQAAGQDFPCDGSVSFIDVPPNSSKDGSPTIVVPIMTTAIGYHLKVGDVDQRVEWKLPGDWREKVATPSTPAPAATEAPAPAPAPETGAPEGGSDIPPGWDKDGDGLIDTDAPIGDTPCETAECLIEKNREGAEEAERSEGPSPWVRDQLCDAGQTEYC